MNEGNLDVRSQITFLYCDQLDPIDRFYCETLGLELVEDQRWAKTYATCRGGCLGIVRGDEGFHHAQEGNAVLVTVVVDNVQGWYDHLQAATPWRRNGSSTRPPRRSVTARGIDPNPDRPGVPSIPSRGARDAGKAVGKRLTRRDVDETHLEGNA
jgi:catechol 2,3-dioxygenase-like lactoylglutathione lyase family enzyme